MIGATVAVRRHLLNRKIPVVPVARNRRGLFRFGDGAKIREIDPIEVIAAMESHPEFCFHLHPKRCERGESEAFLVLADAVRKAFRVPEYSQPGEPGLTVRECWELYCVFARYVYSQKKSTNSTPILPPDLESTSSSSGEQTTSDMWGSGSIESEHATSKP
jgi:hypothetical protein